MGKQKRLRQTAIHRPRHIHQFAPWNIKAGWYICACGGTRHQWMRFAPNELAPSAALPDRIPAAAIRPPQSVAAYA